MEGTSAVDSITTELYEDDATKIELAHYNRPPDTDGAEEATGEDKFHNSSFHGDLTLQIRPGFSEIST